MTTGALVVAVACVAGGALSWWQGDPDRLLRWSLALLLGLQVDWRGRR